MQMFYVSIIILIGLIGIAIGGMGVIIGLVVEDQTWGWEVLAGSFVYMLHPSLMYWAYKQHRHSLVIGLSVLSLICSIVFAIILF